MASAKQTQAKDEGRVTTLPVALNSGLAQEDFDDLRWAYRHLEHPSLAARLSNMLGTPIEAGFKLLPRHWYRRVRAVSDRSIQKGLTIATSTLEPGRSRRVDRTVHRMLAAGSGAAGGFFGAAALLADLPLTTVVMLRGIAAEAQAEGEDLSDMEARLACLQVFALGARSRSDQAADTGYYGLRTLLAFHLTQVLVPPSERASVPAAMAFGRSIAARFGVVVTDKLAAQSVPVAGAIGGATINLVFLQHFQDVARGHFIVRRLERSYGRTPIRHAYQALVDEEATAQREYSPVEGW